LFRSSPLPLQMILLRSIDHLALMNPVPEIVMIDIPIGLPNLGQRRCDAEARKLLGPRRSSIFPAPLRPVLSARSWKEACDVRQQIDGQKMSLQAWNITHKVREVDALLQAKLPFQTILHETHPELAFAVWAGEPLAHSKKSADGRAERAKLVSAYFGEEQFQSVRQKFRRSEVADDDILDAFAALWSAERLAGKKALLLPREVEKDDTGVVMQIII
ncbi:MAG: DUF429 domain-containing protein, partial [Silvanigrellaceae bacterium]